MRPAVDDLVAAASLQEANSTDIRIGTTDASFGSPSFKKPEPAFAGKFAYLLTYGPRAALAAGVLGFAWAAGSYFSGGQPSPTIAAQESVERAELLRMKQEIRALQAWVEATPAVRNLSTKDATVLEDLKRRLDAVKRETGAAIAELAGKVERMQRKAAAKFSPVREQRNQTATSSRAVDSELVVGTISKQARKRRGDAFDPSQNPGAPGVPRSLGSSAQGRVH